MKIFLPLTSLMLLLAFQSNAQSVTLTLDNIPEAVQCNEIWTEQNVSLSFASTTTDDCTPDLCFFGIGGCYWRKSVPLAWPFSAYC